ncbi:hypothetical protein AXF42_Ash013708 [Apostasia shenzhenica]|uniref:Uncharacterized protein n=1 Tax=Apostasia shenzhenica TaxID=1088818 RepID=A0A2I0A4M9_9ASPA|nr:hypothetical protein AXF42_Ash013708 [Apostasia shenzhenica]
MLSVDKTSSASCSSSKVPGIRVDRAQTLNFSIRDYVFESRGKVIHNSWPFPSQLLELCQQHDVQDLLPPFEAPSSLRIRSCVRPLATIPKISFSPPPLGEVAEHIDLCLLSEEGKPDKFVSNDCELGSTVTNHTDIEKRSAQSSEQAVENCRLILSASDSTVVSDLMASKVCPVCKTFSSTSNTTLNVHMDQCLSPESVVLLVGDKNPKLNAKPRKKRLMKDIYANAPRCTLEDLDRRNGTCWATDVNMAVQKNIEVNAEAKTPTLSQVVARDEQRNDIGSVYVDSNGIKLRILSKVNDASQVISREEVRPEKCEKVVREEKSNMIFSKRKLFKLKKEKPRSIKLCQDVAVQEGAFDEETNQMEDRSFGQLSNERDLIGCYGSTDLQKWCCSKRSDKRKKFHNIDFYKRFEQPKIATEMTMLERRKPASDTNSTARRQFVNYSRSAESNTAVHPSKTVWKIRIQKSLKERPLEGTSANAPHLKLSRKTGNLVSSIGRTNEDFDTGTTSNEKYCLQRKKEVISTEKLRKHRSFPGTRKRKREFSSADCSAGERSAEDAVMGCSEDHAIHRRMNSGAELCQIAERESSEKQVENSDDDNCVEIKSVRNEDQGLLSDPRDEISSMIPMQEIEIPMKQVLLDEQEKQTPDEIVCRVESEATSAQESSACLTSHGDHGPDIQIGNSWLPSASFVPNQGDSLVATEPSRSPSSSDSTISPASPKDSEALHNPSSTKGNSGMISPFSGGDKLAQGTTGVETHEQFCIDSSSNNPQLPLDHQHQFSNLRIMPNNSFGFYPNPQTDPPCTPILESPSGSILSRAFNDFGLVSPSCGTPTQSSSNSILRLMGKNLMVVNSEESAQIPKMQSLTTDNNSNEQSLPPNMGFTSYAAPKLETHIQSNVNHNSCITKEVIFVDDSANGDVRRIAALPPVLVPQTVLQVPLAYLRPPSHLLPRYNGFTSSYLINQGRSFEDPVSLLPNSFVLGPPPSTSHMNPPFYYPQSLR